jgi:ATP-dependent DNA helicase RecG
MKEIDKILNNIEDCITNNYYLSAETEKVELKPTPPSMKEAQSLLQSVGAFMNTDGGMLIIGIKDNNKGDKKNYELKGYKEDFEGNLKLLGQQFTDIHFKPIDVSEYIIGYEVKDFMKNKVCVIYIDKLPDEMKYIFLNKIAYKRTLTADEKLDENAIARHEEFKEEIKNARELNLEKATTLKDIDIEKLNDYIYLLNREIKVQSTKTNITDAKPFLTRKKFIIGDHLTTLGMLVCGKDVKDFLGWRAQVDGFVDIPNEVAQDKRSLIDNVISLMERSLAYILKNIQIGVSIEKGGTSKPEYPEQLLRETINNAIAHRDYSINKYININIKPNAHIEIRNPGSFKKQLLIEMPKHELPIRRIIPDSKPRNPNLADVLKVFDKWEGKARGMSNLVNEALANKIDLPYYHFYSKDDLGLFIPKGKLVDDAFVSLLTSFDLWLEMRLDGASLTEAEIAVLAYFYKSEKANDLYRYTILLTSDNNHVNAIQRLVKAGIVFIHPESPDLYPIFLLHRDLMRENYNMELRQLFGGDFDAYADLYKQTLSLIYRVNHFSKEKSISATQAGRLLYYNTKEPVDDIKKLDAFKRKIYKVFQDLVEKKLLLTNNRQYFVNLSYVRTPSIFDKN